MVVGVIGLGLIGGSFAKAACRAWHDVRVWNRTRSVADDAVRELGVKFLPDDDIPQCDLVIVCLPPERCASWVDSHSGLFKAGAVVMDVAGMKAPIMKALKKYALDCKWSFVGAHPMAGREKAGYANSCADMFRNASMVLTPWPSLGRAPLDLIERFCGELGFAGVIYCSPEEHDGNIAYTSQLPHAISYAYCALGGMKSSKGFTGGSFADMTRIASSDPSLWSELFIENSSSILPVMREMAGKLEAMARCVESGDKAALTEMLASGKRSKEER